MSILVCTRDSVDQWLDPMACTCIFCYERAIAEIKKKQAKIKELEQPSIIDGMKYDCIGEVNVKLDYPKYSVEKDCYTEDFQEIEVGIDWEDMKKIYTLMHNSRIKNMKEDER